MGIDAALLREIVVSLTTEVLFLVPWAAVKLWAKWRRSRAPQGKSEWTATIKGGR